MKSLQLIFVAMLISLSSTYGQEWSGKNHYKRETGQDTLLIGHWLKKDRKKMRLNWHRANVFNLNLKNGYEKYNMIRQRRDFYKWFDKERLERGHDIKWPGMASIVAGQFSKMDIWIIRFAVGNRRVVSFANEGNKAIFDDVFGALKEVYSSNQPIKGNAAAIWDTNYVRREQCEIVDSIYLRQREKELKKIEKMAKGVGIFRFGVPKELIYEGDIRDCDQRFNHGIGKLKNFYEKHSNDRFRESKFSANSPIETP